MMVHIITEMWFGGLKTRRVHGVSIEHLTIHAPRILAAVVAGRNAGIDNDVPWRVEETEMTSVDK